MKQLFFLASLASLACISCKSKKETAKIAETTATTATSSAPEAPITYRLIVSFFSKGGGIDGEAVTPFLAYVSSHEKKPSYKEIRWGREGETDYCFNLSELAAKKDLVGFIEEIKKITAKSDRVSITENAECLHKGR
jgi:hypothetical protein